MNKQSLIEMVYANTGVSRWVIEKVLNSVGFNISQALARGDKVRLTGFGTFEPKKRAARIGRNPHTNEPVPIPARVVPVFTPGNELKDAVSKTNKKK